MATNMFKFNDRYCWFLQQFSIPGIFISEKKNVKNPKSDIYTNNPKGKNKKNIFSKNIFTMPVPKLEKQTLLF